ncbi:uncharacterized protein Dwil_GK13782 [Drosophila willistoni]|uniref:TAF6 C-terminal HEAT repeat domain-containing protein n=2 Tax=Drosophila willistoni TaxID=7260 RepID=B4NIP9_DROWI|nr:uncharacterized protein Dwil_GK13782 [Drosophila willistoni]
MAPKYQKKKHKSVKKPTKLKTLEPESETTVLPKSNAVVPNRPFRFIKEEKVRLKPRKRILSREQLGLYKLITAASLGKSENKRRRALQTLTNDPALNDLLPALCLFISNAVNVNVVKLNMSKLLYLMRMVRALVANSSLCLQRCLHQLIPAVLTCLLTRQDDPFPADHWALREYSGNIIAEIVWHFDNPSNGILPRVIGIYNQALQKLPLTTVYGAVIGLGKLGNYVVRAYLVPQIAFISSRIEPHLKDRTRFMKSKEYLNINRQASRYIRHRILKVCTPVLMKMHSPPHMLEKFAKSYGFLGFSLCAAVTVSRIKAAAISDAKKEAAAARLTAVKRRRRKPVPKRNKSKIPPKKTIQKGPIKKPFNGRGPTLGKGIARQTVGAPPQKLREQKPQKLQKQKPKKLQGKRPQKLQEQKPLKLQEQKPLKFQEQKPEKLQEQKPQKLQEQKPQDLEEEEPRLPLQIMRVNNRLISAPAQLSNLKSISVSNQNSGNPAFQPLKIYPLSMLKPGCFSILRKNP